MYKDIKVIFTKVAYQLFNYIKIINNFRLINFNKFCYTCEKRVYNLQKFQKKYKYSIIPVSYFEPIPDLEDVNLADISGGDTQLNIEFKYNFSFVEHRLANLISDNMLPAYLEFNPMFPIMDMAAYASMIETYRPNKIIEIGSGFSACFAKFFIDNLNLTTRLTCIEPYPNQYLIELSNKKNVLLKQLKIQDITEKELDEIKTLQSNDILFIDTSHVSYRGSDTNYIFIKLLPLIQKNVIIQIHDIFLPYDYDKAVYYKAGNFYNEQYLLASILANCDNYLPLYSSYDCYMTGQAKPISGQTKTATGQPNKLRRGASFWMQKLK